jgi:hypothetical protein
MIIFLLPSGFHLLTPWEQPGKHRTDPLEHPTYTKRDSMGTKQEALQSDQGSGQERDDQVSLWLDLKGNEEHESEEGD